MCPLEVGKSLKIKSFFEDSSDCIPLQNLCYYNVSMWYFKYFQSCTVLF